MYLHLVRVFLSLISMSILYGFMDETQLAEYWGILNTVPVLTIFSSFVMNEMLLAELEGNSIDFLNVLIPGFVSILIIFIIIYLLGIINNYLLLFLLLIGCSQFFLGVIHTVYLHSCGHSKANKLILLETVVFFLLTLAFFQKGSRVLIVVQILFYVISFLLILKWTDTGLKFSRNAFDSRLVLKNMLIAFIGGAPIAVLPLCLRKLEIFDTQLGNEFFIRAFFFSWSLINGVALFFHGDVKSFRPRLIVWLLVLFFLVFVKIFIGAKIMIAVSLFFSILWVHMYNNVYVKTKFLRDLLYAQLPLLILIILITCMTY
jgi:hypothetical protein